MAYVKNDEDEQSLGQAAAPQTPEKVLSSDTGTTAAPGAAAATGGGSSAGSKNKGTGWTNLVSYVDANKPQAQGMAQRVTGNIQDKGSQAQTAAKTFESTANETIKSATPQRDQTILDDLGTNAAKVANDENRRKQFEQMSTATYGGPAAANEVEGYQDVASQYGSVQKNAQSLEDFEGRRTAIADAYEPRSDYSAGQQRLDSFLVGQGPARDTILQTKADYGEGSNFGKGWQDLVSGVTGNIDTARTEADKLKADTAAALEAARGKIDTTFKGYADKAAADATTNAATLKRVTDGIASKDAKIRAAAFKEIGLDPATGDWLRANGYSMKQLIAAGQQRKAGDYASQADIDQLNALYGLSGKNVDANLIAKTGAAGTAFDANKKAIASATEAKKLQDTLNQRLAAKQAERDAAYAEYNDALTSYRSGPSQYSADPLAHVRPLAKLTGMDPATLARAAERGVDLSGFLSKGAALNVGDVTTDAERKGWTSLLGSLGISPNYAVADSQDEGAAYNFDLAGLQNAINTALAPPPIAEASGDRPQDFMKVLESEAMKQKGIATAPLKGANPMSGGGKAKKKYF